LVLAGIDPITYFNKGSSDMMYCIGGKCKAAPDHDSIGAVGYADVNKLTSYTPGTPSKYGYVQRMLHNGFGCVTGNCDNSHIGSGAGLFAQGDTESNTSPDNYKDVYTHGRTAFWADQHLYSCPWDHATGIAPTCYPACGGTDWINQLCAYASNASNLPASQSPWWAAQSEMQVTRANSFANIVHKNPAP